MKHHHKAHHHLAKALEHMEKHHHEMKGGEHHKSHKVSAHDRAVDRKNLKKARKGHHKHHEE